MQEREESEGGAGEMQPPARTVGVLREIERIEIREA
jgi:hypothetical protein